MSDINKTLSSCLQVIPYLPVYNAHTVLIHILIKYQLLIKFDYAYTLFSRILLHTTIYFVSQIRDCISHLTRWGVMYVLCLP